MMKTLYHGFDGLDVAYQGFAPKAFRDVLQAAKEAAQRSERAETVTYGGETFEVFPTGASGYSYRLDTGPDGETWFIQNSDKPHGWALRVSVKSMALALYGFDAVREKLDKRLKAWGAEIKGHAIGRIDFAVDVEAPDFAINPERIVCHWRATCSQHREQNKRKGQDEFGQEIEIVGQGGKINSVTVGKMPGRQVIIYNKRREVIDRRKVHWWKLWYPDEEVTEEMTKRHVWRVEVRAGKRHLKDNWKVTTFDELRQRLPGLLTETLEAIRLHADEQSDTNVSRQELHPLWQTVALHAEKPFGESDRVEPRPVIVESQKAMQERYEALVAGLTASYAVVCGVPVRKLKAEADRPGRVAHGLMTAIRDRIKLYPGKIEDAHKRAEKRLRFMMDADAWGTPAEA